MQISNIGVALVMDSLGYLRMYDVWRGEKIAKLIPSTAYVPADGRSKKWFVDRTMFLCDDGTSLVTQKLSRSFQKQYWLSTNKNSPQKRKKLFQGTSSNLGVEPHNYRCSGCLRT